MLLLPKENPKHSFPRRVAGENQPMPKNLVSIRRLLPQPIRLDRSNETAEFCTLDAQGILIDRGQVRLTRPKVK
jgi:hypothetical protein